jgi:hypothetical protein
MARDRSKRGPERPEVDAAKRRIHDDAPGEARVRGPEERTPGEDVLGEDLRAEDELLGEHARTADDLLSHAESQAVPDRIADQQRARQDVDAARERGEVLLGREAPESHGSGDLADVEDQPGFEGLREPEQTPAFGALDEPDEEGPLARDVESGAEPTDEELTGAEDELRELDVREGAPATGDVDEGLVVPVGRAAADGPGPGVDPEKVERAAAWEHAPDLERTSMILERGEGETGSLSVARPSEQARFDPISSAAYDEPTPGTIDLQVPGAGITVDRQERGSGGRRDVEPPPASVREVQRPHEAEAEADDEATRQRASTRHGRRTKKAKEPAQPKGKTKAKSRTKKEPAAERPRRKSRRSAPRREQQPGTREAGATD